MAYVLNTTCLTQDGEALPVGACAGRLAGMFGGGATAPVGPGDQGNNGPGDQGNNGPGDQGNNGSGNQGNNGSGNQGSNGPGNQGSSQGSSQGSNGPGSQGSNGPRPKRQPLGELISVNLELAGLRGQPVYLSWSIFQQSGPSHLSEKWLGNFVAYRLEATTNDDTGTLEMWIPLPKHRGPYFIQLTLSTSTASLASMNSGPFY